MIWDLNTFATSIEILYVIPLGILIAVLIASFYGKLNLPIAFIGVISGILLAWLLAPYIALVMGPLTNTIWYGYDWTLLEAIGLLHIISVFSMAGVGLYNLWRSGGVKIWA